MGNPKYAPQARYDVANRVQLAIRLNRVTDADILEHLEMQSNKQGYIKELVRADMRRKETEK